MIFSLMVLSLGLSASSFAEKYPLKKAIYLAAAVGNPINAEGPTRQEARQALRAPLDLAGSRGMTGATGPTVQQASRVQQVLLEQPVVWRSNYGSFCNSNGGATAIALAPAFTVLHFPSQNFTPVGVSGSATGAFTVTNDGSYSQFQFKCCQCIREFERYPAVLYNGVTPFPPKYWLSD